MSNSLSEVSKLELPIVSVDCKYDEIFIKNTCFSDPGKFPEQVYLKINDKQ